MDSMRDNLVRTVLIPNIDHALIIENNLPKAHELTEKRLIHHPDNQDLLQRRNAFSLVNELILCRNNQSRLVDIMTYIQRLDEYEFLQDYSFLWHTKLTIYWNTQMYEESSNASIRLQEISRRLQLDISVFGPLTYISPTEWAYKNARYDEALLYVECGLEKFKKNREQIPIIEAKQDEIIEVRQKDIINAPHEHDIVDNIEDENSPENESLMGSTPTSVESSLEQKNIQKHELVTYFKFLIDNLDCSWGENVICYGWMCSKGYRKKVSFLNISRLKDYASEKVQLLKSQYILNVICITEDEKVCGDSELLVVEDHVTSLNTYFSLKWQSYYNTENNKEFDKWWPFMQASFNNIYREVIKMMHFLFDNDMVVKDFFERIYVTSNERCVVLPTQVTSNYTKINDCKALKESMKFHLRGRCMGPLMYPETIYKWFKTTIRSQLDPNLLIECCHFWSVTKRIMFLETLHDMTKRNYVLRKEFGTILDLTQTKNETKWYEMFREGTVFSQMVAKANSHGGISIGDPLLLKNVVLLRPYRNYVDILRFFNSAKGHYNDAIYKDFRVKELQNSEIEEEFRCVFPDIYAQLYGGLLSYLDAAVTDYMRVEIQKKLLTIIMYD